MLRKIIKRHSKRKCCGVIHHDVTLEFEDGSTMFATLCEGAVMVIELQQKILSLDIPEEVKKELLKDLEECIDYNRSESIEESYID